MNKYIYRLTATAFAAAVFFAQGTASAGEKDKHHGWLDEKMEDIREDYDKAIKRIEESSFTEEQKKLLTDQAAANRDLAISQAQAEADQTTKNRAARSGFDSAVRASKKNRKAVKEVDDIL